NFDGVTAPILPAGWTAAVLAGSPTPWRTDAAAPDAGPNAAYAPDPNTITDNALLSPPFVVAAADAQLSFRNSYNFEAGSLTGYDGAVLEIKIGAGAFTDILAAGGSFVSGGYDKPLSLIYGNPL